MTSEDYPDAEYFPHCPAQQGLVHDSDFVSYTGVPDTPEGFLIESHYQAKEAGIPEEFRPFESDAWADLKARMQFNGQRYCLQEFKDTWVAEGERPVLHFTFSNSEYIRFKAVSEHLLVTHPETQELMHSRVLPSPPGRRYPIRDNLAHSFGVCLLVVSGDDWALLVQRGPKSSKSRPATQVRSNVLGISINEGLRRSDDGARYYDENSPDDASPQVSKAAVRGARQELSIDISDNVSDIRWVNFGINWARYQPSLLGYIRLSTPRAELHAFLPKASDFGPETSRWAWCRFEPDAVASFLEQKRGAVMHLDESESRPRDPMLYFHAACAYYALIHDARSQGEARFSEQDVLRRFESVWMCPSRYNHSPGASSG